MRTAIITGASSGIGAAFARAIACKTGIDQIWLIARRAERLRNLADELPVPACCIEADLATQEGIGLLKARIASEAPDIRYLVNAAGLGKFGDYQTIDIADEDDMIELDCRAMVDLTTISLPYMTRGARILEVVSCAAFTPLPHMNVYAACKAFMQSYTRGLRWELHGTGICATAVCPAWVKTEFVQVAQANAQNGIVRHIAFAQKPATVARRALVANRLHFAVACCGIVSLFVRIVGKFIPHCITIAGWEGFRRI